MLPPSDQFLRYRRFEKDVGFGTEFEWIRQHLSQLLHSSFDIADFVYAHSAYGFCRAAPA